MGTPKVSTEDFVGAWQRCGGSPSLVSKDLGISVRAVYARRSDLAARGTVLESNPLDGRFEPTRTWSRPSHKNPARLELELLNGVAIVFSDCHYWPGEPTPAHSAVVALTRRLKPKALFANGDVLDGARISRHPRNGWEQRPTLRQELDVCKERVGEIEDAAGLDAELIWNLGNHDARFERYLSTNAPEFEGMMGATLPEHFPRWTFAISTMINPRLPNPVMVKHRHANGIHAAYNNTVKGGISTVTSHLHRLIVTTWGDYRGRRYGVDTGTVADPDGPQFTYREDDPSPAGQGFAVLTFHNGELLAPELVEVRDGTAFFRGEPV